MNIYKGYGSRLQLNSIGESPSDCTALRLHGRRCAMAFSHSSQGFHAITSVEMDCKPRRPAHLLISLFPAQRKRNRKRRGCCAFCRNNAKNRDSNQNGETGGATQSITLFMQDLGRCRLMEIAGLHDSLMLNAQ